MRKYSLLLAAFLTWVGAWAQTKSLHQLQQDFIDLRFGMFIHFNMPTYADEDWPDPDLPADVAVPTDDYKRSGWDR